MQKYILIILLLLAACSGKKEIIDDRYIIFNLYTLRKVPSYSIALDFKDRSVLFIILQMKEYLSSTLHLHHQVIISSGLLFIVFIPKG